jgi:hypothetical protein
MDRQKLYGLAIHQANVLEIESQWAGFLLQQGLKSVDVVTSNLPTDAQNYTALSDCLAVDFANHFETFQWHDSQLPVQKAIRSPLVTL